MLYYNITRPTSQQGIPIQIHTPLGKIYMVTVMFSTRVGVLPLNGIAKFQEITTSILTTTNIISKFIMKLPCIMKQVVLLNTRSMHSSDQVNV